MTYVWILVDGAGDEGWDVCALAEDLREGIAERRCRLDSRKVEHPDIIAGHQR